MWKSGNMPVSEGPEGMEQMKRLVSTTALVLALVTAGSASAADRIRMLAPTWLGFAPVHVANDLGYFKDLGLEVDYKFEDDRANVMAAYARDVYKQMGLYIMLIVAFAIVLSRAEVFAMRNKLIPSMIDGAGMGVGFLLALALIGVFREFLGKGALWGVPILDFKPLPIMILPAGGFFAMGLIMGGLNWIDRKYFGGTGASSGGH